VAFEIRSKAFSASEKIPREYSGEGKDISPPLLWRDVPKGTQEFALICEDPDAPQDTPFVHWIAYKIPANVTELPQNLPKQKKLAKPVAILQGVNSFDKIGYGGPMPPKRHGTHHYHFRLLALDSPLPEMPGLDIDEFKKLVAGHVLEQVEVIGTYERH
jgi:Raf kinase inhibitor-like YbhB/YbcL family protein